MTIQTPFSPTDEQLFIREACKSSQDNLIIYALAGAAKTSTLVLIAKALSSTPTLCLAFNKKIQIEMEKRLPGNCTSMTLNGIGHRTWARFLGKNLTLNTDKTYQIVKGLIEELKGDDRKAGYEIMSDLIKAVDSGKTAGYVPTDHFPEANRLMDDDEFFAWLDEEPSDLMQELIIKASLQSLMLGMNGTIDFNDQILLPTVFPATFPTHPLVLVDEAQDLSALNHAMLSKIAKKRLIAVGDPGQSIYGFRGAHANSMELLQQSFSMKPHTLSISFRCPIAVVKVVQWRAPHMKWPEWAKEGEVKTWAKWTTENIPEYAMILCRNNAPLFSCAIKLLRNGRGVEIVGNDIGKAIAKTMKKFGDTDMPQADVLVAIDAWKETKLSKARSPGNVLDQAACMVVFAEQGATLGDALAYMQHIFSNAGPIKLSTIHKSKGLEWDNVFILDRELIRTKETQEKNLLYVACTRAKESLNFITTEGFME